MLAQRAEQEQEKTALTQQLQEAHARDAPVNQELKVNICISFTHSIVSPASLWLVSTNPYCLSLMTICVCLGANGAAGDSGPGVLQAEEGTKGSETHSDTQKNSFLCRSVRYK